MPRGQKPSNDTTCNSQRQHVKYNWVVRDGISKADKFVSSAHRQTQADFQGQPMTILGVSVKMRIGSASASRYVMRGRVCSTARQSLQVVIEAVSSRSERGGKFDAGLLQVRGRERNWRRGETQMGKEGRNQCFAVTFTSCTSVLRSQRWSDAKRD